MGFEATDDSRQLWATVRHVVLQSQLPGRDTRDYALSAKQPSPQPLPRRPSGHLDLQRAAASFLCSYRDLSRESSGFSE